MAAEMAAECLGSSQHTVKDVSSGQCHPDRLEDRRLPSSVALLQKVGGGTVVCAEGNVELDQQRKSVEANGVEEVSREEEVDVYSLT